MQPAPAPELGVAGDPVPPRDRAHAAAAERAEAAERDARTASAEHRLGLFERFELFVSRLSTRSNFFHRLCSMVFLPYAFRSGIKMKRTAENTFSAILPFRKFNRNWYNAMAGAALLGNSEIAGGMYVFGKVGGSYMVVCRHLEYTLRRPCLGPAEYRVKPREDIDAQLATGREFDITIDMDVYQLFPVFQGKREKAKAKERARMRGAARTPAPLPTGSGESAAATVAQAHSETAGSPATDAASPAEPAAESSSARRAGEKRVGRVVATFHCTPMTQSRAKGRR